MSTPASVLGAGGDRRLMDGIYRHQRHIYDLSRKYYLLGRDRLIAELRPPDGSRVLEIGCGTGRNLIAAAHAWPRARVCGLDISAEMLKTARASLARHRLGDVVDIAEADAVGFDSSSLFNTPLFSRVYFSYTLSMIPDWEGAIAQGWKHVAPGGKLMIVDFGQCEALPSPFRSLLWWWLRKFHVTPRAKLHGVLAAMARRDGASLAFTPLYRGYAWYAVLTRPEPDSRGTSPRSAPR